MIFSYPNRRAVLVLLGLVATLVWSAADHPAHAGNREEPVPVTVITEHRTPSQGPPRGPELARDQASLEVLWNDYGFTKTGGAGRSQPPPPPAPVVDFDRYVAIAVSTGGRQPTLLRTDDALILDTSGSGEPVESETGQFTSAFWLLAVDRGDLPVSPFRLVERANGRVFFESTVSVTLPHTGVPVAGALAVAVVLAASGAGLVARGGRHRRRPGRR